MSTFNKKSLEDKLRRLNSSQESIETLSHWIIHHKQHGEDAVKIWKDIFINSDPEKRLCLFYLINDVLQNSRRRGLQIFHTLLKPHILEVVMLASGQKIQTSVERMFKIWRERKVFDKKFIDELKRRINMGSHDVVIKLPSAENLPIRDVPDFKASTLCDALDDMQKFDSDLHVKAAVMNKLRLDVADVKSLSLLKDKSAGGKFLKEFDENCTKLTDYCDSLAAEVESRRDITHLLTDAYTHCTASISQLVQTIKEYRDASSKISQIKVMLELRLKACLGGAITSPTQAKDSNTEEIDMDLDSDEDIDAKLDLAYEKSQAKLPKSSNTANSSNLNLNTSLSNLLPTTSSIVAPQVATLSLLTAIANSSNFISPALQTQLQMLHASPSQLPVQPLALSQNPPLDTSSSFLTQMLQPHNANQLAAPVNIQPPHVSGLEVSKSTLLDPRYLQTPQTTLSLANIKSLTDTISDALLNTLDPSIISSAQLATSSTLTHDQETTDKLTGTTFVTGNVPSEQTTPLLDEAPDAEPGDDNNEVFPLPPQQTSFPYQPTLLQQQIPFPNQQIQQAHLQSASSQNQSYLYQTDPYNVSTSNLQPSSPKKIRVDHLANQYSISKVKVIDYKHGTKGFNPPSIETTNVKNKSVEQKMSVQQPTLMNPPSFSLISPRSPNFVATPPNTYLPNFPQAPPHLNPSLIVPHSMHIMNTSISPEAQTNLPVSNYTQPSPHRFPSPHFQSPDLNYTINTAEHSKHTQQLPNKDNNNTAPIPVLNSRSPNLKHSPGTGGYYRPLLNIAPPHPQTTPPQGHEPRKLFIHGHPPHPTRVQSHFNMDPRETH